MRPPAPFVVGVPRSGTTLLRLQLDAHPELCIGAETGFGLVAGAVDDAGGGPAELVTALRSLATWPDLRMDEWALRELLDGVDPWSVGDGLRAWYRLAAAAAGKRRWGDKTPVHARCLPVLARLIGEARFVHIVRDGRDVAASLRGLPFAPGEGSIEAIAADWRDTIREARAAALEVPHYLEVRYERLVTEPEAVLREVCAFVELDFHPGLLAAHERAASRLAEQATIELEGGVVRTGAERLESSRHTSSPPDSSRIGRWRQALSPDEAAQFEALTGELLDELGYR
jgi:hypothetical protein